LARTLSTHELGQEDARLLQQLMTQAKRMEHAVGDLLEADQLTRGEPSFGGAAPRSTRS
jgi:hypothetical protein